MVKEIRIYIEGGGDGRNTKALMRQGWTLDKDNNINGIYRISAAWEP